MLIKKAVKQHLNRSKRWWCATFRSFTPSDLTETLTALGISAGDVVLAHIAFNEFVGFTGRPSDVFGSLRAAVSRSGTLLMPSMPFQGSALEYVQSGQLFDVRRTPSQMGMVTELFRRSAWTRRSLHPTHAVLANGPLAEQMICDHLLASTPCGRHSPFAKLAEIDGKIALLGTGIGVLTFYHYLEELLESRLPESPFTNEAFEIALRDYDGEIIHVTNRLYNPALSRRRLLGVLEREMKSRRVFRQRHVGRVAVVVLEARAVSEAVHAMAERGIYCYA